MKRVILALAVLALGTGVATIFGSGPGGIHAVHEIHAEQDLDCETCHDGAATSMSGTDLLLPSKDVCADCHDVDDETECGVCHTNFDDPAGYAPRPAVAQLFPHAAHIEGGMACADCHGSDVEPVHADKSLCRDCHPTVTGREDCGTCHAKGEELIPATHTPGWLSFHGIDASWDQAACENCHSQTDCESCHAGDNVRPRTHGLNFAFEHAVEARANELLCVTCHEEQEFCQSCHVAERILPNDHSRGDWVLISSGGRHAEEALFGMENCIACHDAGDESPLCADCHGE